MLATGKIERVGSEDNAIFHYQDAEEYAVKLEKQCIPTYTDGIQKFLDCLLDPEHRVLNSLDELERVGFKTVLSKDHYWRGRTGSHQTCCRAWRIIWTLLVYTLSECNPSVPETDTGCEACRCV